MPDCAFSGTLSPVKATPLAELEATSSSWPLRAGFNRPNAPSAFSLSRAMASDIPTFNARNFRNNPIYRQQASLAEIQAELQKLERFHRQADRQYNNFTVGLIICIAMPLVLLFTLPALKELGWLLILGFVLGGICMGAMRTRARQCHFPQERDRLFANVLTLLKRDISPQEPFNVQLCLGQATQTGKVVQQRPDPQNLRQALIDWRNPWFSIKSRFLDGNLFSLRLVEHLTVAIERETPGLGSEIVGQPSQSQTQEAQPSSPKAQQPTSSGFELHLQLHSNPDCYGDLTALAPHLSGAVKLLPGAALIRYYAAEQDLGLTLNLPVAFTPSLMYQSIVMLLLSAYHILHLAAQLRDHSPAPTEAALFSGPLQQLSPHGREWGIDPGNSRNGRPSLDLDRNGHSPFQGGFGEA